MIIREAIKCIDGMEEDRSRAGSAHESTLNVCDAELSACGSRELGRPFVPTTCVRWTTLRQTGNGEGSGGGGGGGECDGTMRKWRLEV